MAALTACIRQAGNGALQRCAASAWNHISQPLTQVYDYRESELHASEPGVFMSAADATRSSPESRNEIKLSMPDFMWMGKGDKRTFRGKLKRGSYGKMRPRKLKDPLRRKAWWHQEPSESSNPVYVPIPYPSKHHGTVEAATSPPL